MFARKLPARTTALERRFAQGDAGLIRVLAAALNFAPRADRICAEHFPFPRRRKAAAGLGRTGVRRQSEHLFAVPGNRHITTLTRLGWYSAKSSEPSGRNQVRSHERSARFDLVASCLNSSFSSLIVRAPCGFC